MKRPSFQFYPGDWLNDFKLSMCSLAAQGLWVRVLCYMHQGEPYGYLRVNGTVIPPDNLPYFLGQPKEVVLPLWDELMRWGVPSQAEDGCYFSRRMVEDERKRVDAATHGAKGGNPLFKTKQPKTEPLSPGITQGLTPRLTDPINSSSSSSSVLHDEEEQRTPGNSQPETTDPVKVIETYLQGKTRQLMIGQTVYQEILAWLQTSAGDTDAISRGIDEGLKMFQQDNPGAVPDTGLFYRSFVRKAIERLKMQTNQRTIPLIVPVRRQPEEDETSKKLRELLERGELPDVQ